MIVIIVCLVMLGLPLLWDYFDSKEFTAELDKKYGEIEQLRKEIISDFDKGIVIKEKWEKYLTMFLCS